MYYLICIEHMNRERIIAKIHDIPQIHRSFLMLRNLQQPLRTIIATRRDIEHPIRHELHQHQSFHTARQTLRRDLSQYRMLTLEMTIRKADVS